MSPKKSFVVSLLARERARATAQAHDTKINSTSQKAHAEEAIRAGALAQGLWVRFEDYEQHIGKHPSMDQLRGFVKNCALIDLKHQLGGVEPTRQQKEAYLRIVKTFIWDAWEKKKLTVEQILEQIGPPF